MMRLLVIEAGEIGDRGPNPRYEVARFKRLGNRREFSALATWLQARHLREHEFEILQQRLHSRIGADR